VCVSVILDQYLLQQKMNHTGEWSDWQKVKETVKFGGCGELGNVGGKVRRW